MTPAMFRHRHDAIPFGSRCNVIFLASPPRPCSSFSSPSALLTFPRDPIFAYLQNLGIVALMLPVDPCAPTPYSVPRGSRAALAASLGPLDLSGPPATLCNATFLPWRPLVFVVTFLDIPM